MIYPEFNTGWRWTQVKNGETIQEYLIRSRYALLLLMQERNKKLTRENLILAGETGWEINLEIIF